MRNEGIYKSRNLIWRLNFGDSQDESLSTKVEILYGD